MQGFTEIEKHNVHYQWTIKEFKTILEMYKIVPEPKHAMSPIFHSGLKRQYRWVLRLKFNNEPNNVDKDWVAIGICCYSTDIISGPLINGMFTIMNSAGQKVLNQKIYFYNTKSGSGIYLKCWTKEKILKEIGPSGKLTICCDLNVYGDLVSSQEGNSVQVQPRDMTIAMIDAMCSEKEDFTFIVSNERIPARRSFLIARSPVFSAMLSHDMKEKNQNEAVITDINEKVFKKMLEFIYTDKVVQMEGLEADLLAAAEKYQLLRLKNLCEEALHLKINVESVLDLVLLADRNNAQQLLCCAVEFFKKNCQTILGKPQFEVFAKANPTLLLMLFRQVVG